MPNPDTAWVRRRFTIAHEIGHLMFGHTCTNPALESNPETEANQFAAELLMPLAFLRADYKKEPDLDKLSAKYIVSREALCLYLMECRII